MDIRRNPYGYGGNINHSEFCERLDQAKKFFNWKYYKEGDKKTVLNKKTRTERFTRPLFSTG